MMTLSLAQLRRALELAEARYADAVRFELADPPIAESFGAAAQRRVTDTRLSIFSFGSWSEVDVIQAGGGRRYPGGPP